MVRPYPPADMELIGAGVDHREPAAIPAAAFGWTRFSESAVPERYDAAFYAPAAGGTRNSLVTFDAPPKLGFDGFGGTDIGMGNGGVRDSSTSVASGFEPLQYWPLDDFDAGELSHGSLSMTQPSATLAAEPFLGVSVDVNNHSINNQGVVMYHVDVRSPDGVLATYTIRRRYRAFKNLYAELSKLMDEFAASSTRAAADAAFSNKVVTGVAPREPFVPLSPHSLAAERRLGGGGAMAGPPLSIGGRALELPSLPSAGVWSYLKRHDVHLVEQRKRRFQEILRLAIRHPATRHSAKLEAFLGVAPSEISQRGSSYVSLMDYSVPVVDRQRESIERRQRKLRVLEDRRLRTASTEAA